VIAPTRSAAEMRYGARVHRLSFAMVFLLVACGSVNSTPPLDAPDKRDRCAGQADRRT